MRAFANPAVADLASVRARRALAWAAIGFASVACDDSTCHEEEVGASWVTHTWGDVAINDLVVAVDASETTRVNAVRQDGSLAGVDDPGRFAAVPVHSGPLEALSVDEQGLLSTIGPDGMLFESTLSTSGAWSPGPTLETSSTVRALAAGDAGSLWVVGTNGLVARFDGAAWFTDSHGTSSLEDVWASASEVFIVGESGAARMTDGGEFEDVGPARALYGVFGLPSGERWAVGEHGLWLAWDGAAWRDIVTPTDSTLRAVWGDPDAGSWAAGDEGTLLHLAPHGAKAVVETLPDRAKAFHFTAIAGARTPRGADAGKGGPSIALWAATAEGIALSREPVISTICE